MQLSKPDFEAIKNGTAHTPDAPIECSSLIRMTKDDLSAAMGRKMPTILQKRDRRVLADCLELKERIKTRSDAKGVFAAAMKLKNGNPLPFHAVETNIQTRLFRELLSDKGADGLNLEIIEDCVNFRSPLSVFSEHPSFRRFYGGGGRDILGMNGMLSYWLENRYEEAVKYLSVIADATAYALSTERRDSEECLPIDERWLGELKGWMDVIFVYQGSSYSYELVGSPDAKVSKSVFMAVTALLGLHLPRKEKTVRIQECPGGLEISGVLAPTSTVPYWRAVSVSDLTYISHDGSVEGTHFLAWLTHSLPDMLDFRMEGNRLIFRMRSWNQTEQ